MKHSILLSRQADRSRKWAGRSLAEIALQKKTVMHDLLFKASADTLEEIAADPRHLGAGLCFIGLLHPWGQTLQHHPHVHYGVPGGGLGPDRKTWVSCRPGFFLPVRVLSRLFRGKYLALVRQSFARGRLTFQGGLAPLADPGTFTAHLASTYEIDWNVYAKEPFGGAGQVLKYQEESRTMRSGGACRRRAKSVPEAEAFRRRFSRACLKAGGVA